MGLLTRIFGNREDDATGAGEGSEETIETDRTLEPEGSVQSEPPVVPADAHDAAPNRQPVAVGSAPRQRHAGANVSNPDAGGAIRRGAARAAGVEVADGPRALTATPASSDADGEDSEEIDVSDQLEELDDLDSTDDLDASGDLILEDEEDEETSTSVSTGPPPAVGDASATVRVAVPEELGGVPPPSKTSGHGSDERRDPSSSGAQSLGSATREIPKPDPERMRMPSEMKTPKQTLVEAGTELKGSLESSCPVVVNGTIDGDIDAPSLSIAPTGAIMGTVKAKTLRSQGTLSGQVQAEEVFLSGAVRSKTVIKTRRLEVKLGSADRGQLEVTFGNCDLELSDRVSEPESGTNPLSSDDSESDLFTSSGWESADVTPSSAIATAAPFASTSPGRSTSKSSRRGEASGEDTKKTLR